MEETWDLCSGGSRESNRKVESFGLVCGSGGFAVRGVLAVWLCARWECAGLGMVLEDYFMFFRRSFEQWSTSSALWGRVGRTSCYGDLQGFSGRMGDASRRIPLARKHEHEATRRVLSGNDENKWPLESRSLWKM